MNKRLLTMLCALCLLPALLTGCWQEPDPPADTGLLPTEDESAVIGKPLALPTEFALPFSAGQMLDPLTCPDGMQQTVGALLYEGLFALNEQLEPKNILCREYSYDSLTFTYVFFLRDGVVFSDGSPLTAADVSATLNRAKSCDRYRHRLAQVRTVAAQSGAVVVTLTGPNARFPALLDIPIVKAGSQTTPVPVGTGPYRYGTDETGPCLLANDFWWSSGGLPVQRIRLQDAKNRDIMLYQFFCHEVQLITVDLTGAESVSVAGDVTFQDADTTVLQYVGFNTLREPFSSPALRQAMALGVNRGTLVTGFLSGHGAPAQFPVSPVSPLYPAALETPYSYNAFQAAMTRLGYVGGETKSVTLLVNQENSFKVSAAGYVASALSAFDLDVTVQALPWAEYTAALAAGNFDLYYGEVKLTADWNLAPLVGSGGALNYGGFTDPLTDQLLESCAASGNAAAMEKLCARLQERAPLLPVCFKSTSVLTQGGVIDGLTPTAANPFHSLSGLTIALAQP